MRAKPYVPSPTLRSAASVARYVDDSISTAPESTLAALEVYAGREITLLVGGYDRGIDYSGLVANGAPHNADEVSGVRNMLKRHLAAEEVCLNIGVFFRIEVLDKLDV